MCQKLPLETEINYFNRRSLPFAVRASNYLSILGMDSLHTVNTTHLFKVKWRKDEKAYITESQNVRVWKGPLWVI